eukprot:1015262-Amphidinium_carterae.1
MLERFGATANRPDVLCSCSLPSKTHHMATTFLSPSPSFMLDLAMQMTYWYFHTWDGPRADCGKHDSMPHEV